MWRLVLTVSLLCCSSEGSVTCRDKNNGEVDWYILYKTPRIQDKGLDGLDYVYIYPDANGRAKSQRNDNNKKINNTNGVLANTLQPLFDFKEDNPSPHFGFISYNDQPPEYLKKSVSPSHGHSKGVVMVEKNGKGVWLLHSTPKFPYKRDKDHFWPESGTRNAQTFICVTFPYKTFKDIGEHLQRIRAFPFDSYIPSDFHDELKEAKNTDQRNYNTPQKNKFPAELKQLNSSRGKEFYSIAKQRSADGKPEVGDLYVSISVNKEVNSSVYVQTWGGQGGQDGRDVSFCPTNGKKVENIESVKTGLGEWKPGNDHSKWCVAENQPWTCIADVNRAKSQYKRPGGALCVKDEEIHRIFKNFVQGFEECQNPGQKRDGSNVVTGVKQKKSKPGK